jgi:wyosine [tRNA(Phe)-imidazoG37] synthetase (radical SAM superfamily)
VPDLKRGPAPAIDLQLLANELREFMGELLHGSFMEDHVPADMRRIVDVALSGNGEPTSAHAFPEVITLVDAVLRENNLAGSVVVRLITNGSLVMREHVQEGLRRLGEIGGEAWFKVDAGTAEGFRRINNVELLPQAVARNLRRCAELCPTWVQTCMFELDGVPPGEEEISAYLGLLTEAGAGRLRGVHLYGLARPSLQPEASRLSSLSADKLEEIALRIRTLGLTVQVSP